MGTLLEIQQKAIVLDRDARFKSRFWKIQQKALEDMLRVYVMDFAGSWNKNGHIRGSLWTKISIPYLFGRRGANDNYWARAGANYQRRSPVD